MQDISFKIYSPQCRMYIILEKSFVVGNFPNFTYLIEIHPYNVRYLQQNCSPLCRIKNFPERSFIVGIFPNFLTMQDISGKIHSPLCRMYMFFKKSYLVGNFRNLTYLIEIRPHNVGYLQQNYSPLCRIYIFSERSYIVGKFPNFIDLMKILPHNVGSQPRHKKLTLWGSFYPTLWGIPKKESAAVEFRQTPQWGIFF